jgi:flagellin
MKGKAQEAANDTLGADERAAILTDLQEFNAQIDAEVAQAQWSGIDILSTTKNFQIGQGITASGDEMAFNIATTGAGLTSGVTFNSSGLSDTAAGTSDASVTEGVKTELNAELSTSGLATLAASNATAGELDSGHYTLYVTTTGAGSTTGVSVSVQLRDADGNAVTLDADGVSGGNVATTLSTTLSVGEDSVTNLDLGIGFNVDLESIATSNTTEGAVVAEMDYSSSLGSVGSQSAAQVFMQKVDDAITNVNKGLAYIGTQYNRLLYQEESLATAKVNAEASVSRIVDADIAFEQLQATKYTILQQTATAMLAQASASPQAVLSLFR